MDRRQSCRYPAVIKAMVLSLNDTATPTDHSVQLENVSMQGCLIKSPRGTRITPGQRVRMRALGEISTPSVEGIVLSVFKPLLGKRSVRIRFLAPLSYQTFKMLVYGVEGVDKNQRDRPEYENDQFWR